MATSFQPETPHEPARTGRGTAAVVVTAVLASLATVMLLALLVPTLSGSGETNWLLTLGAGLLVLVLILGVGLSRK